MIAALRGALSPTALVCGLVLVAADLVVLFTRTSWIGFLGYTPEWANAGLYVMSPLIAGVAAFLSRRYFSMEVLSMTGGRVGWGAVRTVLSAWLRVLLLAVASHLIAMGLALTVTLAFGSSGTVAWEPFVYALLPLAMAAALGVALSAVFPHLWAAVLAVVVTYIVWYLAVITSSIVPVNVGGATISLSGLGYRHDVLIASIVASAVVVLLFLSVAVLSVRWQNFAKSVTTFAVVTGAVVIAGTLVGARVDIERFSAVGDSEFRCAGSSPSVCLTTAHSARLEQIAAGTENAGRHLADAGVDLSGIALREQLSSSGPGPDGSLLLSFGQLNGIGVTEVDYAYALLRPASCEDYWAAEPTPDLERLLNASQLVSEWLDEQIAGAAPKLEDEQVVELYNGLATCDVPQEALDRAALP